MSRGRARALWLSSVVDAAIKRASERSSGQFDGLYGSLPDGASIVLKEIVGYLRSYLLEERRIKEPRVRALMAAALPPETRASHFRSVPRELEDEGIRVAIGLLNTLSSIFRVKDGQIALDGEPLSVQESYAYLLSGRDGLRGAKVRAGGSHRGADTKEDRTRRYRQMQQLVDQAADKNPQGTFREWAQSAAHELQCHETTVRKNTRNPRSA